MFSPGFTEWAKGNYQGQSSGNGAMMRVSPVGYLFNTEEDVIKNSHQATIPSHNTKDALYAAQIIALIIFYARKGMTKQDIRDSFIEFKKYPCPFKDCMHLTEEECRVKIEVKNNNILESRYEDYKKFIDGR